MKRLSRKMLCLFAVAGLLAPLVVRAQEGAACDSADIECQALAYTAALAKLRTGVDETRSAFGDYVAYLSTRFEVDLRFDGNGQDVLSGLYPSLTKLIEQDVASKYGLSLPLRFPGGRASQGLGGAVFGSLVGAIGLAVYLGDLYDQRLNGSFINAMAEDIRGRGWSYELAQAEANHQFTMFIQRVMDLVLIQNESRDIQIVISAEYYIAWQGEFHRRRAELRQMLADLRASIRGHYLSRPGARLPQCRILQYDPDGHSWGVLIIRGDEAEQQQPLALRYLQGFSTASYSRTKYARSYNSNTSADDKLNCDAH